MAEIKTNGNASLTFQDSVFFQANKKNWAVYEVELAFTGRLIGGIPKDPAVIESWIRSKAGITDTEEIRRMVLRTIAELDPDISPEELNSMTYEQALAASEKLAASKNTVGFKQDANGLYIEQRNFKACLKENCSIAYRDEKWLQRKGRTEATADKMVAGKSARGVLAERVFVHPEKIYVGRQEPDGIWMFVGHVPESRGSEDRRSTLTYYEYVDQPTLKFQIRVYKDTLTQDQWAEIWGLAEENGAGAVRSQSQGMFVVRDWRKVEI